jgi:hypothetical protein
VWQYLAVAVARWGSWAGHQSNAALQHNCHLFTPASAYTLLHHPSVKVVGTATDSQYSNGQLFTLLSRADALEVVKVEEERSYASHTHHAQWWTTEGGSGRQTFVEHVHSMHCPTHKPFLRALVCGLSKNKVSYVPTPKTSVPQSCGRGRPGLCYTAVCELSCKITYMRLVETVA